MNNKSGYSLLELIVGVALCAGVLLSVFVAYSKFSRKNLASLNNMNNLEELSKATNHIFKVGALASSKNGAPCTAAPNMFSCSIESNGVTQNVRFRMDPTRNMLLYEVQNGQSWGTGTTYRGIKSLEICDDASLRATPTTCPIPGAKITTVFSSYVPQLNRFFRFRLSGVSSSSQSPSLTAAVFVRDQAFTGTNGYRYQWGTEWN